MATFWATLCLSKFIKFELSKQFQRIVCCRFLRFQKWFVVNVLGFQIEFCCRYFGFFLTWQLFGLFFEKFGNFFSNLLVTLLP
jgi:hypothetical protein